MYINNSVCYNHTDKNAEGKYATEKYLDTIDDAFRLMNYWGWLENIRDDETEFQINEMKNAGLGGYVAHARGGLEVPYMGEKWQSSVKKCIEMSRKTGIITIMDDEDGWPSGFGAGEVNGRGHYFHQKFMKCEHKKGSDIHITPQTLGIYRINDGNIEVIDQNKPLPNETLIHIYYMADRYYTDTSDPVVVDAFIDASYKKYEKLCGDSFGSGLWGIFSDEPQISRERMQWSLALPAAFEKRHGYNPIDRLPCLYDDGIVGAYEFRHDFYETISWMFAENYAKKIGEWCEGKNLIFTGHTTIEEQLRYQITCTGNTMQFYEYFTIPGIDWLCRIGLNSMIIKQLTSVSAQLGKIRTLSESYGCAGWNISFEEMKWIAEWQMMFGVDLLLQHLGLYSLKGSRKREYPAALFYQQPWWKKFKSFNDYFARYSKMINKSREKADTLVIHSMETAWILKNDSDFTTVDAYNDKYNEFLKNLLLCGVNFHLGDAELIRKHGKIEDGVFKIGKCAYTTVIVPESESIAFSTVQMLRAFADAGGKIISTGSFPTMCAGVKNGICEDIARRSLRVPFDEKLYMTLQSLCGVKIYAEMCDGQKNTDIYTVTREMDGEIFHIIFNSSQRESRKFSLKGIPEKSAVLSLETMEYICADTRNIELEPMRSLIICEGAQADKEAPPDITNASEQILDTFEIKHVSQNTITLDSCRYSTDGGDMQPKTIVTEMQKKLLKNGKNCDLVMSFEFYADYLPSGEVWLVCEEPEKCEITLNGASVDNTPHGYFSDKSFKKLNIDGLIKKGNNEIIIKRRYENSQRVYDIKNGEHIHEAESNRTTVECEPEAVYIMGDFSVDFSGKYTDADHGGFFAEGTFSICKPKKQTDGLSLTKSGFPFFAGEITLTTHADINKQSGKRIILDIERPEAVLTSLRIGDFEHDFMWAPYKIDITDKLQNGINNIELTLYTSNRNLLGPHHNRECEPYGVGPHSFIHNQNENPECFALVNFGLSGGVRLLFV